MDQQNVDYRPEVPIIQVTTDEVVTQAPFVFRKVFRSDHDEPGCVVLVLPASTCSKTLRILMVELKGALSVLYAAQRGEPLEYLSMGRFDQQTTTKLHLDGAPEISLLMLGYEPTVVSSELQIADYSRCASKLGLSPELFLRVHNPMFALGLELLKPYTTSLSQWHEEMPRIVIINNSNIHPANQRYTAGVLHGAIIGKPDPLASRIINSTMIAPASFVSENVAVRQAEFLTTDRISGVIQ